MNTNNTYVFVLSARGGVGKSTSARNLLGLLVAAQRACRYVLVEVDGSLGGFNEELLRKAERLYLDEVKIENDGDRTLDAIIRASERDTTVVVDLGANTMRGLLDWAARCDLLEVLAERSDCVWFAFVAASGDPDCLSVAQKLANFLKEKPVKWLLLRAQHTGDEFSSWDSFIADSNAVATDLPTLPRALADDSYRSGRPFALLAQDKSLHFLQAARFIRLARLYAAAFAPIFDGFKQPHSSVRGDKP